jgi:hypothetical protein
VNVGLKKHYNQRLLPWKKERIYSTAAYSCSSVIYLSLDLHCMNQEG